MDNAFKKSSYGIGQLARWRVKCVRCGAEVFRSFLMNNAVCLDCKIKRQKELYEYKKQKIKNENNTK